MARRRQAQGLKSVIVAIREHPGITRAQLARLCRLSKPAVTEIVRSLISVGLVREDGVGTVPTGRKPIRLRMRYEDFLTVAIDVGGTNLRGALVNLNGEILWRHSERTDPGDLEGQLLSVTEQLLHRAHDARVIGIGVGVPGTVDPVTGVVWNAPALGKRDFNVIELLKKRFQLPVVVENDVNLAAVGEHWRGAARGAQNAVCISIGTGIGAGLIIGGGLYRGSHNLAGEVGYFFFGNRPPDTPLDGFGDLESRASGWGIRQRALHELGRVNASSPLYPFIADSKSLDARSVFEASAAGDPLAQEIAGEAAFWIGATVAAIVSLLDVDVVVLTGGIMRHHAQILPTVNEVVAFVAVPETRDLVDIQLGKLGDEAVLIGAAHQLQEAQLPTLVTAGGRNP